MVKPASVLNASVCRCGYLLNKQSIYSLTHATRYIGPDAELELEQSLPVCPNGDIRLD